MNDADRISSDTGGYETRRWDAGEVAARVRSGDGSCRHVVEAMIESRREFDVWEHQVR